jgi:hypothetical protein
MLKSPSTKELQIVVIFVEGLKATCVKHGG